MSAWNPEDQWSYYNDEWNAIAAMVPGVDHQKLKRQLVWAATRYRRASLLSSKHLGGQLAKAERRFGQAAHAFLMEIEIYEAFRGEGTIPSRMVDELTTLKEGSLDWATVLDEIEEFVGAAGGKGIRRRYLEDLMQIWEGQTGKSAATAAGEDAGALLDFLACSTRPVLVGGDRLGVGDSGRDALRHIVGLIRREGYKHLLEQMEF